jgi:hypothetical protein
MPITAHFCRLARRLCAALFLIPLSSAHADALTPADFRQIPLHSVPDSVLLPDNTPLIFVGETKTLELHFFTYTYGEQRASQIDGFTEIPVTITNRKTFRSCAIDGGIWVRKEIYLSADERILILGEHSGAYGGLTAYDTQTCREIRRMETACDCDDTRCTPCKEINLQTFLAENPDLNQNLNPEAESKAEPTPNPISP